MLAGFVARTNMVLPDWWVVSARASVTVNDVGLTISISVFTAQAAYYKETNVNAA